MEVATAIQNLSSEDSSVDMDFLVDLKVEVLDDNQVKEPDTNEDLDESEIDFFFSNCNNLDGSTDNDKGINEIIDLSDDPEVSIQETKINTDQNLKKSILSINDDKAKHVVVVENEPRQIDEIIISKEPKNKLNPPMDLICATDTEATKPPTPADVNEIESYCKRPKRESHQTEKYKDFHSQFKSKYDIREDETLFTKARQTETSDLEKTDKGNKAKELEIQDNCNVSVNQPQPVVILEAKSEQIKCSKESAIKAKTSLCKENNDFRDISNSDIQTKTGTAGDPKNRLTNSFIDKNKLLAELLSRDIQKLDPKTYYSDLNRNGITTSKKTTSLENIKEQISSKSFVSFSKLNCMKGEGLSIDTIQNKNESDLVVEEDITGDADADIKELTVDINLDALVAINEQILDSGKQLSQNNTFETVTNDNLLINSNINYTKIDSGDPNYSVTVVNEKLYQDKDENNLKGYKVSKIGDFKVLHDENGAIVKMEECTETEDLRTDDKIKTEFEGSIEMDIEEAFIATESTYAIDVKLLAKTSVDLVNCSQMLQSARYCRKCQTLFPKSAAMNEHTARWHPRQGFNPRIKCRVKNKNIIKSSGKYCFLCHRVYSEKQFLYAHINSAHIISLNCKECNREFPLQELLDDHVRTVHRRTFERKQFNIVGRFNKFSKVSVKKSEIFLSNAVFECGKCQINFVSYAHCKRHYNKCKKDLAGKLCVICRRIFSPGNCTHSIQHKSGCELVTYIVDSTDLKVVGKCPKCGVHYPENLGSFKIHLGICSNIVNNANFKCCDLQLSSNYFKEAHEGRHDKINYTVLNYRLYKK